jgi:hypothetical protein
MSLLSKPCYSCGGPKDGIKGAKFCLKCRVEGPLCSIHNIRKKKVASKNGSWYCTSCDNEHQKARYAANQPSIREKRNAARYGLTVEQYRELLAKTDGKCSVCGDKHSGMHVDHSHRTGKVRGLLCKHCNLAIGHAKDSPARLRALAKYLEG